MQWDYWRLLTVLSLAGFVGLVVGHMMAFLFVAALIYIFWMQSKWNQLQAWLGQPHSRLHHAPRTFRATTMHSSYCMKR